MFTCICKSSNFPSVTDFKFYIMYHLDKSEKTLHMISVLLNLLILVLLSNIWSILENVFCMFEKNVYSCFQNVFCVRFILSTVLFKFSVFLLILCLDEESIVESGILTSTTIIIAHYFSLVSIAWYILRLQCWVHEYLVTLPSWKLDSFIII